MRVRRAVLGDEHFIAMYNVPVKVGVSLSLLTSDLTMSDRQSKKRRWFSYRSSCSLQIRHRTSTLQPTERTSKKVCLTLSLAAVPCGYSPTRMQSPVNDLSRQGGLRACDDRWLCIPSTDPRTSSGSRTRISVPSSRCCTD